MKFTKYHKFGAYHWKQYDDKNTKYSRHADMVKKWIKEKNVLDVGAGDGKITHLLKIKGVDNEPKAVELAQEKGADVILADAYNLPYKDENFDSVFMGDVLEHLEFPDKALSEARRVLKKYLYLALPEKGTNKDKFHYQEWTPEELKELVEKEAFILEGDIWVVSEDKRIYGKFKKITKSNKVGSPDFSKKAFREKVEREEKKKQQRDLSILIPARNEMFLTKTIEDILANIEADTEIIVTLDGRWADPVIEDNERVTLIYLPKSIGQRAGTNFACKLSKAKYVMKVDAHCSFDKGFDRKMIEAFKETGDNVVMVPVMRNLWAFDWKCYNCGWKKYQGPTPKVCPNCGETKKIKRKMMWIAKTNPQSKSYCFDSEPHFQYFNEYKKNPQYKKDLEETGLTESMSIQGSCFMVSREKYWEFNLSDESIGSWGSQGIEVACKFWLSGGRVLINHRTWYAHMFRTQGGDFSFPYTQKESQVQEAKKKVREIFFNNKWEKAIHPLSYLVEKFWPVKGWSEEDLKKIKK